MKKSKMSDNLIKENKVFDLDAEIEAQNRARDKEKLKQLLKSPETYLGAVAVATLAGATVQSCVNDNKATEKKSIEIQQEIETQTNVTADTMTIDNVTYTQEM